MSLPTNRWPNSVWRIINAPFASLGQRFLSMFSVRRRVAEPVRISGEFKPEAHAGYSYVWVPEYDLPEREAEGFTYYLRPADGAKCYRRVQRGKHVSNEFLMVAPKRQLAA
jgi:hypothetical protein